MADSLPSTATGGGGAKLRALGRSGGGKLSIDHPTPEPIGVRTTTVDRLRALRDGKRDILSEVGWAALGVALGAAPNAVPAALKFTNETATLTQTEFWQLVLMCLGMAVAVTCVVVVFTRGKRAEDIFEAIVNPKGKDA